MIRKLLLVDYACHPFSIQLAQSFSKKNIKVFYVFSKNVNLTGNFYKNFSNKNLKIIPIKTKNFYKYNFLERRSSEIEFATSLIKISKQYNIKKVILANVPIDPLYKFIKYCNWWVCRKCGFNGWLVCCYRFNGYTGIFNWISCICMDSFTLLVSCNENER